MSKNDRRENILYSRRYYKIELEISLDIIRVNTSIHIIFFHFICLFLLSRVNDERITV